MNIRKEKGRDGIIYRVDAGRINGKRVRFSSTSKKKAEAKLAKIKAKQKAVGDQWAKLSESDKVRLSQIHEEIDSAGFSLAYVWDEFRRLRGRDTASANVTVSECAEKMIETKKRAGRARKTIIVLRDEMGHFNRFVRGDVADVSSITVGQVEEYCHGPNRRTGKPCSPATVGNRGRRLIALFSYAMRIGWCDSNPAKRMEKVAQKQKMPYIIPNDHVRRIMSVAMTRPDILPQIILCLFAGLRAGEAHQMKWSDIDLERGVLVVRPEISKMRDTRIVKPHATALAWLAYAYAHRVGDAARIAPFHESTVSVKVAKVRAAAKLLKEEWAHAAMRHTAATHLYHITESLDGLARNMGHSMNVFFKHYRGLVDAEKSKGFWKITPDLILSPPLERFSAAQIKALRTLDGGRESVSA